MNNASLVLPPLPFVPGQTERPDETLFEPLVAEARRKSTLRELARCAAFTGGRQAYEAGYFWEAHELWEAVWMRLPPASAERHLLRGLIQLSNSNLKVKMGRPRAAMRIADLADAAFREAFLHGQTQLMGVRRHDVSTMHNNTLQRIAGMKSAK